MPYEIEEKSSNRFLNATQIAILLSLGIHLFVYRYGFPVFLFKEKPSSRDDIVSTIELSPLEQARLPNLDSQSQIPEFNPTSLDKAAPPFALPLPPNFTPDNLPPVPVPPGYKFPTIPRMGSDIRLPPLGISDISALPLPPPLENIDDALPSKIPLTTPEAVEETPAEIEQPSTPPTPEAETKTEENIEAKPTPEQIAAVREQKLTGNIRDVSQGLQKQNRGTTNEDARRNYIAWLSRIEKVEPESIEIAGIYPKDACIRRLDGTSVYGVLIDAESQVVGLELIKGAEYPIFNEQASENIQQHEFTNDTEEIKPYRVTVNYQYDAEICPSLTLPSLRKQKPKSETEAPIKTPEAETETEAPIKTPEAETETEAPIKTPEAETEATEETPPTTPQTETEATEETPPTTPQAESEATEETPPTEAETESEATEETPPTTPQTESEATEETPPTEAETETENPSSLRERLQNTPLPSDDNIRERLRQNPLPE